MKTQPGSGLAEGSCCFGQVQGLIPCTEDLYHRAAHFVAPVSGLPWSETPSIRKQTDLFIQREASQKEISPESSKHRRQSSCWEPCLKHDFVWHFGEIPYPGIQTELVFPQMSPQYPAFLLHPQAGDLAFVPSSTSCSLYLHRTAYYYCQQSSPHVATSCQVFTAFPWASVLSSSAQT